jgi:hypothetical protein
LPLGSSPLPVNLRSSAACAAADPMALIASVVTPGQGHAHPALGLLSRRIQFIIRTQR